MSEAWINKQAGSTVQRIHKSAYGHLAQEVRMMDGADNHMLSKCWEND